MNVAFSVYLLVESAIDRPNIATDHFPAVNFIVIVYRDRLEPRHLCAWNTEQARNTLLA